MASSKDYLAFVQEQLSGVEGIRFRAMMGEFLLYFRGKVVGGIYDNRFLMKPLPAVRAILPDAPEEIPYPNAKPMLLVEQLEDAAFMQELFAALEKEFPL